MPDELKTEVNRNYDFFQRHLSEFLKERAGQYALLKSESVVDFYDGPGEAYRAGLARYPNRVFSIQRVTSEPVDLGFMSLAFR